ncbi:MAG: hypothetical protein JWN30_2641 [Bacilli bacterium]|nr:hypothetical protein [Bacilli bacterium]
MKLPSLTAALKSITLLTAGTALFLSGFYTPTAQAAGSTLVRVLLSAKTSYYDNSRNTVTFIAKSDGFQIGFQAGSVYQAVYSVSGGGSMSASLDDYFVEVKETSSYTEASSIVSALASAGYTSTIALQNRQGTSYYAVDQGYYDTSSDAQSALTAITGLGYGPKLEGFDRLSAGSFKTAADAQVEINSIRSLGVNAYLAGRVLSDGTVSYEVWVGDAGTTSERDQLAATLSSNNVPAAPVSFSSDYVLMKTDVISVQSNGSPQTRPHTFSQSTGQELKLVSQGSPGLIRFEEKGATYRGNLIVEGHAGRLAVVNELPVDDYVKGVVPKEMASGWPIEALKAQAVAARTYVMRQSPTAWGIAAVDDSIYSQAYGGYLAEAADTSSAVDQTSGQVLMYDNGTPNDTSDDVMIDALFSSSHGGRSADSTEVWGNPVPYLQSVDSSYDSVTEDVFHEPLWYRVMFPSGMVGYIRSDFVKMTGLTNADGLKTATIITDGANIRANPDIAGGKIIGSSHQGDLVTVIDSTREWDLYSWMKGPYSASDMQNLLGFQNPVTSLYVSKVGVSGRPLEITANGSPISVNAPDDYRAKFGTISNLFTIEQMGSYTVKSASGTVAYPVQASGQTLYALGAAGSKAPVNRGSSSFVILGSGGNIRVATTNPTFVLHGNGNGHGLGMSQWGAYGMAQAGYNYQDILRHYYTTHVYVKTLP